MGIDKSGLVDGLLYDLCFDIEGWFCLDFVFNCLEYCGVCILLGGVNFGCGLSWEYVVWGL